MHGWTIEDAQWADMPLRWLGRQLSDLTYMLEISREIRACQGSHLTLKLHNLFSHPFGGHIAGKRAFTRSSVFRESGSLDTCVKLIFEELDGQQLREGT